jgi:miniconductance mechanosensitive channel
MMLPLVVDALDITSTWMVSTLHKGVDIYFVVTLLLFVSAMFKALFALMVKRPAWQGKPLNGLLQIVQVVLAIVGVILIVAIILDKSPVGLLAGLGASAAVISFIFKDTLLGLVAGVQLSANNMLKVGDWIEMPSRGVDGTVIAVSLTTIKIRGWDNTIQTIPPYVLVSEPFTNWQAMRDTGGRRIKRSINIDVSSVKFADQAFVDRLAKDEIIASLIGSIEVVSEEGAELTNLDLYMRSVNSYIQNHPRINHDMIAMVRQLQPTERGVPIELYFFTVAVDWIPHENLQTEIISRVIALASHFDINIYQAPSGLDFKR